MTVDPIDTRLVKLADINMVELQKLYSRRLGTPFQFPSRGTMILHIMRAELGVETLSCITARDHRDEQDETYRTDPSPRGYKSLPLSRHEKKARQ